MPLTTSEPETLSGPPSPPSMRSGRHECDAGALLGVARVGARRRGIQRVVMATLEGTMTPTPEQIADRLVQWYADHWREIEDHGFEPMTAGFTAILTEALAPSQSECACGHDREHHPCG